MHSTNKLAGAARACLPQNAYSALQRSGQRERQHRQRTALNIESCFDLLDMAIKEEFFPALFGEAMDKGDYRL